jgi:hypothetical protein
MKKPARSIQMRDVPHRGTAAAAVKFHPSTIF